MTTSAFSAVGSTTSAARAIIHTHSKSFSLASLLLAPVERQRAEALYAYCRRADDAIDLAPAHQAHERLRELRRELGAIYAGHALREPILAEFQRVVFETSIPRDYPEALLHGFALDASGASYETMTDLYHYCWCVAGSVGAMMCHALGVRRERAVAHGAHLGMAMQLTNICRDVAEDWQRGRLYLPRELAASLYEIQRSHSLPSACVGVCARAVRRLLAEAEALYRSGDRGLPYLAPRARLAIAAARNIYSAIGTRMLQQDANVLAGRAVVSMPLKLWHLARALATSLGVGLAASSRPVQLPTRTLRFPEDVLPL
jgi:15-cis-phytoene synthase